MLERLMSRDALTASQAVRALVTRQPDLTRQDAEEKTMDLVAPVLGRARGRKLIATLFEAQKLKSLRALRSLYSA